VAEAVLRYISHEPNSVEMQRGEDGVSRGSLEKDGRSIRIAVVSGLAAARALLEKVLSGEEDYELIEVMACPGGCVMGGGQPSDSYECLRDRAARSMGLRALDASGEVRCTQDNAALQSVLELVRGSERRLLHRAGQHE
ncbi:MAG: ferredoxin, partial [Oscillospiraceae bacterium]|nr:ferredoxin [Oscillospiraceae bacterium]